MIGADRAAAGVIDVEREGEAGFRLPSSTTPMCAKTSPAFFLRLRHAESAHPPPSSTRYHDLAAGFSIEWRLN